MMSTQVRVAVTLVTPGCSRLQSLSYGKKASQKALVGAAKECPPRVGGGRVPNHGTWVTLTLNHKFNTD